MKNWIAASLIALPVVTAGGVYYGQTAANGQTEDKQQQSEAGYVCPVTGEVLPCESCCQLNNK